MVTVARERMVRLFREAEEAGLSGSLDRADRYVRLARRIGTRYNVRLSPQMRERLCRGCSSFLLEGRTSRTRLRSGRRVRTCLRCGRVYRLPLPRTATSTPPTSAAPGPLRAPVAVPVDELGEEEGQDEEGVDEA